MNSAGGGRAKVERYNKQAQGLGEALQQISNKGAKYVKKGTRVHKNHQGVYFFCGKIV